jgi:hypothetical protein
VIGPDHVPDIGTLPEVRLRVSLMLLLGLLAGCASDKLNVAPAPGVDLSGNWKLNIADSDDPSRLSAGQGTSVGLGNSPGGGPQGGGGGGRGGRGGRGGAGSGGIGGGGPAATPPPTDTLAEVLRWPGKLLEIKQVGGVAAFTSDGDSRVYQPSDSPPPRKPGHRSDGRIVCGWMGRSLIVRSQGDRDAAGIEARYAVSADGGRLVELIQFRGSGGGFAVSRVWDRVP